MIICIIIISHHFRSFHVIESLLLRLNHAEPWPLCWLHPPERFQPLTSGSEMLLRGHLCLNLLVSQIRQIANDPKVPEFENTVSSWWFRATHLKNMSQNGNLLQIAVKITNTCKTTCITLKSCQFQNLRLQSPACPFP